MRALVLVALLALLPFAQGLTQLAARCASYDDRPGIGPSCAVEGGYDLLLPDGHVLFTHGLDPVPAALDVSAFPAGPRTPACVDALAGERQNLVIYARPADKPDRGEGFHDELRGMVALANGLLDREARERGAPGLDYRMACTEGRVRIDSVVLPFASGAVADSTVSFYRIVVALRALGYDDPFVKHWVWYDDTQGCACGGVADAPIDPIRAPNNGANGGSNYAITFGYRGDEGARILMHESAHNMGAVSNFAPATTKSGHCNDGRDVMCYADGGPNSSYSSGVCKDRLYFDCRHDTYFDARPEASEYLAKRWNLAGPLNRFVQGCLHVQPHLGEGESVGIDVPAECAGGRFAVFGEPTVPVVAGMTANVEPDANDVDVCWYDGEALLRCDSARHFEEGVVPTAATRALVTKVTGLDPRVVLSVV